MEQYLKVEILNTMNSIKENRKLGLKEQQNTDEMRKMKSNISKINNFRI